MADTHPLIQLETVALIGIGGFAGSNLRYFIGRLAPDLLGTLVVNTIGSIVLGFVLYEAMYTDILATRTRLIGATGFLSSFTTYSTFALQTTLTATLLWAMMNIIATYVLGFSGVLLGRAGARAVESRRETGA